MQRLLLHMSQTELAKTLGVTYQQVQKYENGRTRVSASRLQAIANMLEVPLTFFFETPPATTATTLGWALAYRWYSLSRARWDLLSIGPSPVSQM
ncbi:helix-turn-helix domain-containing protein [Sinorhizobium fredii]|uniref:helix-turn-helix domain-containing protein n=2 Tax=Rhizobium fredii TaxID=380 RepID=UPI003137D3BE